MGGTETVHILREGAHGWGGGAAVAAARPRGRRGAGGGGWKAGITCEGNRKGSYAGGRPTLKTDRLTSCTAAAGVISLPCLSHGISFLVCGCQG